MSKYDVRFCKCGRIHIMPIEYLQWLQYNYTERSIVRVCQNCGSTTRTWLEDHDNGFAVCCAGETNVEITEKDVKNTRVLLNEGIRVPLTVGEDATYHINNLWGNSTGHHDVDTKELVARVKANLSDRAHDILKAISGYVSGINWSGTEYEFKY